MVIKNLTGHAGMQCYVMLWRKTGTIRFRSYQTVVVVATRESDGTYTLTPTGKFYKKSHLYTPTTGRQIGAFLSEYFPSVTYREFVRAALANKTISAEIREGVFEQ